MIFGIGTDIVRIERLAQMWERHAQRAVDRLLSPAEHAGFASAADKGRFLAKRFAAKEAFAKASGFGVRPPVSLTTVGVAHDALGRPFLVFTEATAAWVAENRLQCHLSISDEADYAVAHVVLETP